MTRPPEVLTVQATDDFGETNRESLVVRHMPGGTFVSLEPRDGKRLLVDTAELRAALERAG